VRDPGGTDITAQLDTLVCLPAGNYRVAVTVEPPGLDGLTLRWFVEGAERPDLADDAEITVQPGPQRLDVQVLVEKTDCSSQPASISLPPRCPPPGGCPTGVRLGVFDAAGTEVTALVDAGECLPAGRYTVRVTAPQNDDFRYDWSVDGEAVLGEGGQIVVAGVVSVSGRELIYDLGGAHTISVGVVGLDCPTIPTDSVELRACECPGPPTLTVLDEAGQVVPAGECVQPGRFRVVATGTGIEEGTREWTVDGVPRGNGTEQTVDVAAPVVACCGSAVPGTSVSLRVSAPDCPDQTATRTLTVCDPRVLKVCCEVFDVLLILLAGLVVLSVAVLLCPPMVAIPGVQTLALVVGGLALLALVVIFFIWLFCCPPDWCLDILPLLWQVAFIAGAVLLYLSACCGQAFLVIGVLLVLAFAGLLFLWIQTCHPSQCLVIWELLKLGLAQTVVGFVEVGLDVFPGLAVCVGAFAHLFLLVITVALDSLLLLLPGACGFNPRG
jgi:hypothetical protein